MDIPCGTRQSRKDTSRSLVAFEYQGDTQVVGSGWDLSWDCHGLQPPRRCQRVAWCIFGCCVGPFLLGFLTGSGSKTGKNAWELSEVQSKVPDLCRLLGDAGCFSCAFEAHFYYVEIMYLLPTSKALWFARSCFRAGFLKPLGSMDVSAFEVSLILTVLLVVMFYLAAWTWNSRQHDAKIPGSSLQSCFSFVCVGIDLGNHHDISWLTWGELHRLWFVRLCDVEDRHRIWIHRYPIVWKNTAEEPVIYCLQSDGGSFTQNCDQAGWQSVVEDTVENKSRCEMIWNPQRLNSWHQSTEKYQEVHQAHCWSVGMGWWRRRRVCKSLTRSCPWWLGPQLKVPVQKGLEHAVELWNEKV